MPDHQHVVASRDDVALDRVGALGNGGFERGPTVIGMRVAAAAMRNDARNCHAAASCGTSPRAVERTISRTGTVASRRRARGATARRLMALKTASANFPTGWRKVVRRYASHAA